MVRYFAIAHGRITGIFTDWLFAKAQTDNFPYNAHKSFNTLAEAEEYMASFKDVHKALVEDPRADQELQCTPRLKRARANFREQGVPGLRDLARKGDEAWAKLDRQLADENSQKKEDGSKLDFALSSDELLSSDDKFSEEEENESGDVAGAKNSGAAADAGEQRKDKTLSDVLKRRSDEQAFKEAIYGSHWKKKERKRLGLQEGDSKPDTEQLESHQARAMKTVEFNDLFGLCTALNDQIQSMEGGDLVAAKLIKMGFGEKDPVNLLLSFQDQESEEWVESLTYGEAKEHYLCQWYFEKKEAVLSAAEEGLREQGGSVEQEVGREIKVDID